MTRAGLVLATLALGSLLAGGGWWFFTVYDTAEAKCDRGDLGACTVLSQRAAAEAAAEAADAAAEWDRLIAEAITLEDERGRVERCYLRVVGHAAAVRLSGEGADAICRESAGDDFTIERWPWGGTWERVPDSVIAADSALQPACTVPYGGGAQTLTILDWSAGAIGRGLCDQLVFPIN